MLFKWIAELLTRRGGYEVQVSSGTTATTREDFRAMVKTMMDYKSALDLLDWDAQTQMPEQGVQARSDAMGMLAAARFRLSVSAQMQEYLGELAASATLDPVTRRMVAIGQREYDRNCKVPEARFQAYVTLTTQAQSVWAKAREEDDFASFAPWLLRVIQMKREFAEYWGYDEHPYDAMLDEYEPGLTVAELDATFALVRDQTVQLLDRIRKGRKPEAEFLQRYFDPARQRDFSRWMLGQLGYDWRSGRLDETAHPFCTTIGHGDVRITTRYLPHFFNSALFGAIHECGHALYEQNISGELFGTNLFEGTSMGIHESQSRFWENIVGRSESFWEHYYPALQSHFPDQLAGVTWRDFYAAVNVVEPSLIRVEADEVTYNLHIMVRYELEKGLAGGDLRVADLPAIWREKMQAYLGIAPGNDRDGVLQDVHWSSGLFGYFPSYALGNLNSAQMAHAMRRALPDLSALIGRGEFAPVRAWLTDQVYQHGKLKTAAQIMMDATGEPTNATYLLKYFAEKYSPLYAL